MDRSAIGALRVSPYNKQPDDKFDILICAVGFEARACFVAQAKLGFYKRGIALAFVERQVLNYWKNYSWCSSNSFSMLDFVDAASLSIHLKEKFDDATATVERGSTINLLVDITSMSRPMIATLVRFFSIRSELHTLDVQFTYCPSKYVELGQQIYTTSSIGPVTPSYAGWTSDPRSHVVALVGLGGERGLALGAMEYIEATDVWAFAPTGVDERYDTASWQANKELLERIGESRVIKYSPLEPFECFTALELLAYGCLRSERPILVPFGPKIFAISSLLAAEIYKPKIPVWRVSSDQFGEPIDSSTGWECRGSESHIWLRVTGLFRPLLHFFAAATCYL